MFTATSIQAATYLLGVCLFSISFLVFLNSSVSFVITDLIKEKEGVGNAIGNLGFADELVALIACPIWGVLSDRIGVRTVSMLQRECLVEANRVTGMRYGLFRCWTIIICFRSGKKCLPSTTPCQALL